MARTTSKLEAKVKNKCKSISKTIQKNFLNPRIKDYPAMVVVCADNINPQNVCYGESAEPSCRTYRPSFEHELVKILKNGIKKTSPVTGCKNPIGQCAEQHAANKLTTTYKLPIFQIKSFLFSSARRPRTGEKKTYCANCKLLFNL